MENAEQPIQEPKERNKTTRPDLKIVGDSFDAVEQTEMPDINVRSETEPPDITEISKKIIAQKENRENNKGLLRADLVFDPKEKDNWYKKGLTKLQISELKFQKKIQKFIR